MLFRKCACGCGKWVALTNKAGRNKYYNKKHRQNHSNKKKRGEDAIPEPIPEIISWEDMTPYERWEAMNLEQLQTVGFKMGANYGQMQTMYYNRTLPDDFALNILDRGD